MIAINIGGSIFKPARIEFISGVSVISPFPALNNSSAPLKISCGECNTPILELFGGSIVIRSRHHSNRHVTAISALDLANLANSL